MEEWKWIEGFEGHYKISNYGRTMSCKYGKEVILSKNVNKNGVPKTSVKMNNIHKVFRTDELVLETFYGKEPRSIEVIHLDGDLTNCHIDNLKWGEPWKDLEGEIWKDIKEYEGLYQVSNKGRVKSLNYGNKGEEIIMEASTDKDGYKILGLRKEGKKKMKKVHRLVAEAFISNPNNLPQVNHMDEDKSNNKVDNLEWCDAEYNTNYGTHNERVSKTKTGKQIEKQRGKNNKRSKVIYYDGYIYYCARELSEHRGICRGNISCWLKGTKKMPEKYKGRLRYATEEDLKMYPFYMDIIN